MRAAACVILGGILMSTACSKPQTKPLVPLLPPLAEGGLPRDGKDQQPVLMGVTERAAILAHRSIYAQNTARTVLKPEWTARWRRLQAPCVLVVALGSWCGDSQRELPDLLALMAEPNPFVTVHFIGVSREKRTESAWWPQGVMPQAVAKVPTFWAFGLEPGGTYRLVGSIVETPPVKGQRLAEGLLDLLERVQ